MLTKHFSTFQWIKSLSPQTAVSFNLVRRRTLRKFKDRKTGFKTFWKIVFTRWRNLSFVFGKLNSMALLVNFGDWTVYNMLYRFFSPIVATIHVILCSVRQPTNCCPGVATPTRGQRPIRVSAHGSRTQLWFWQSAFQHKVDLTLGVSRVGGPEEQLWWFDH